MERSVDECYDFMKGCNFTFAICGGYALDLFSNVQQRPHSDIDITLFD